MDRGGSIYEWEIVDLEKAAETWLRALIFRQFKDEIVWRC